MDQTESKRQTGYTDNPRLLETPWAETLQLSVRASNALRWYGETVREVCLVTEYQLSITKQCGAKTVAEIKRALSRFGFALNTEYPLGEDRPPLAEGHIEIVSEPSMLGRFYLACARCQRFMPVPVERFVFGIRLNGMVGLPAKIILSEAAAHGWTIEGETNGYADRAICPHHSP